MKRPLHLLPPITARACPCRLPAGRPMRQKHNDTQSVLQRAVSSFAGTASGDVPPESSSAKTQEIAVR